MRDGLAKRGVYPTVESSPSADTTITERLQSVLGRIQDRPGDAPVVVSAAFLRWIAEASIEAVSRNDITDLHSQIEKLTRERDEALESVIEIKAHSDHVTQQLKLADVRVAALSARVAKLRETLADINGNTAVASGS